MVAGQVRRERKRSQVKKDSALAKNVERLRKALQKNHEGFADALGMSRATISAWLRGDSRRPPSAEALFKLGSLCPNADDAIWFWERAGLNAQAILDASAKIRFEVNRAASSSKVVGISSLGPTSTPGEPTLPPLTVPAALVPNSRVVRYLILGERHHGGIFSAGDVVLLDISERNSRNLAPFWDEFVLVEFAPSEERKSLDFPFIHEGFFIGRIEFGQLIGGVAIPKGSIPWVAQLAIFGDPLGVGPPWVGTWTDSLSLTEWERVSFPAAGDAVSQRILEKSRKRAMKIMEFREECRPVGRVISWFRPPRKT